jgi:hypothetical protein
MKIHITLHDARVLKPPSTGSTVLPVRADHEPILTGARGGDLTRRGWLRYRATGRRGVNPGQLRVASHVFAA